MNLNDSGAPQSEISSDSENDNVLGNANGGPAIQSTVQGTRVQHLLAEDSDEVPNIDEDDMNKIVQIAKQKQLAKKMRGAGAKMA